MTQLIPVAMDSQTQLNTIIQRRLHESLPFTYRIAKNGCHYVALLKIGEVDFWGSNAESEKQAKQEAASVAISMVSHLNENQLRMYLGLALRRKVREIDAIRNALIDLKFRCRALFDDPEDYRGLKKRIWRIYPIIDSVEETLLNNFYVSD